MKIKAVENMKMALNGLGSCWPTVSSVLLLTSLFTVTQQLGTTPRTHRSTTTEIDHFDRDHPVNVTVMRATPFDISYEWSLPDHENQTELENFVIHFYKTKDSKDESRYKKVSISRNVTSYVSKNLKPGTYYSFQVIANYTHGHQPHSIIYKMKTQGYGEDNPCQCNRAGTKNKTYTQCDMITGQCECNDKHTLGLRCDSCQHGYMWSNITGCQVCNCDRERSTGTCSVDPENGTTKCNCLKNFGGYGCKFCAKDYYVEDKDCKACQCNNNTKGFRKCNYMTGLCIDCQYNTTGQNCEMCKDGYAGDPIHAKNCTKFEDIPSMQVKDSDSFGDVFHRNLGVIVVTCAAVLAIVLLIVGVIIYRHWWRWRRRPLQFWTIQLKEDRERVSFSADHPTYQHVDGGLLPDVVNFYDQPNNGWREEPRVAIQSSGRSRPRTHAASDGSNPYQSLEES